MKVWEFLKKENYGKRYKWMDCNIDTFVEVRVVNGFVRLVNIETNNEIPLSEEVLNAHFEDKKINSGWYTDTTKEEVYYYIDSSGEIDLDDSIDNNYINNYNSFSTKRKAKEIAKEQLLYRKIKNFRDECDDIVLEYEGNRIGYCIKNDVCNDKYSIQDSSFSVGLHDVLFSTKELAQRCLDEVVLPFMERFR